MKYQLGIDIGGTFTDFALYDLSRGRMAIHKRLTTPDDPSTAVLAGIETLVAQNNIAIADVEDVVHGTTLVTNAVIERRRPFVSGPDYFGPDRRRRDDPRHQGPWRRANDPGTVDI